MSIVELSATELSAAIASRSVSCEEVMQAHLAQIHRFNPVTNAISQLIDDDILLKEARALDGVPLEQRRPLHGFPQAPKDLTSLKGFRTTKACPLLVDNVTNVDSVMASRMRAAGSIFVGRANTPELGLGGHTYSRVYGTTHNAFVPERSPGGSSGGSAVAAALYMLPVVDGSDNMGSLRIPAAFNHIYGLRPSYGVVPFGPGTDVFIQSLSTEGAMGRKPGDIALLMSVIAGYDPQLPFSALIDPEVFRGDIRRDFQGVRVAWMGDLNGHLQIESDLLAQSKDALTHLQNIGCVVEEGSIDFNLAELWEAWVTIRSYGVAATNAELSTREGFEELVKPEAIWEIRNGNELRAQSIIKAAACRTAFYRAMLQLLDRYEFLILPVSCVKAFRCETPWPTDINGKKMPTYHRWAEPNLYASFATLPSVCVPAGLDVNGVPFGIQIVSRRFGDMELLRLAHAYDQASGASRVRSPLLN